MRSELDTLKQQRYRVRIQIDTQNTDTYASIIHHAFFLLPAPKQLNILIYASLSFFFQHFTSASLFVVKTFGTV